MLEEQFNTTLKLRGTDRRRSFASICMFLTNSWSLVFCDEKCLSVSVSIIVSIGENCQVTRHAFVLQDH